MPIERKRSGVDLIKGEIHFEDVTSRNVLERQTISKMSGERPKVLNQKFFEANNANPITVTDFLQGAAGQRIYILGDGNMTVEHGTFIFTNTSSNKLLQTNKVYKFTYFPVSGPPRSHKWVEDV